MKAYILSVICCAFLCAITAGIREKKGSFSMILKLVSGIFLVFTVIRPAADLQIDDLSYLLPDLAEEVSFASNMGEDFAESQLAAIIKSETEAYILDKAQALGAEVAADITLDSSHIPISVLIRGKIGHREKEQLSDILETDLGIPKEDQIWNAS